MGAAQANLKALTTDCRGDANSGISDDVYAGTEVPLDGCSAIGAIHFDELMQLAAWMHVPFESAR